MRSIKEICDLDNLNEKLFKLGLINNNTHERCKKLIHGEYMKAVDEKEMLNKILRKHGE